MYLEFSTCYTLYKNTKGNMQLMRDERHNFQVVVFSFVFPNKKRNKQ